MLLALILPSVSLAQQEKIGSVTYVPSRDLLTHTNNSSIMVMSDDDSESPGAIAIKCFTEGIGLVVFVGKWFSGGRQEEVLVSYRFDDNAIVGPTYWPLASSNHTFVLAPNDVSAEFIASARRANYVVVRLVDSDGEQVTHRYPLSGFSRGLSRLGSCE
jgi:hypothetical protein